MLTKYAFFAGSVCRVAVFFITVFSIRVFGGTFGVILLSTNVFIRFFYLFIDSLVIDVVDGSIAIFIFFCLTLFY